MRRRISLGCTFALTVVWVAACGGKQPPPPPPEPPREEAPPPVVDRTAEREAAAQRLCERARTAIEAGNYDTARELLQQARREYSGTPCAESAAAEIERVNALQTLVERVHFEFDKSRITDEAAAVLQRKAEVLRRYPNVVLSIEGHCDERGSLEYNQALGMRRAESAKRYLAGLGVSVDAFRTASFGEERPLVNEHNESAWAMNRRDEFVLTDLGALGR
ncbi:MAG: OmpA family protein [Gemmatimonadota bacterium]